MKISYGRRNITIQSKQNNRTFTYSPLGKAFEKQTKAIEGKGNKTDTIINQSKKLEVLTNKDDHKDNYKKYIFNELVKELDKPK